MSCTERLEAAILADYWLGLLGADEEERIEEHLFACNECHSRLAEVETMAEGVRALARSGSLLMVVSETYLTRASGRGLHIRRYDAPAGGSVQCTVTAEDDLLIGGLAANLSAAKRIDLSLCDRKGNEQFRLVDIPFDTGSGAVLWQQSIAFAKAAPTSTMI